MTWFKFLMISLTVHALLFLYLDSFLPRRSSDKLAVTVLELYTSAAEGAGQRKTKTSPNLKQPVSKKESRIPTDSRAIQPSEKREEVAQLAPYPQASPQIPAKKLKKESRPENPLPEQEAESAIEPDEPLVIVRELVADKELNPKEISNPVAHPVIEEKRGKVNPLASPVKAMFPANQERPRPEDPVPVVPKEVRPAVAELGGVREERPGRERMVPLAIRKDDARPVSPAQAGRKPILTREIVPVLTEKKAASLPTLSKDGERAPRERLGVAPVDGTQLEMPPLAISGREEKTGGQKIAEVSLYSGFEEEGGKSTENRADDQLGAKSPGPASVSLRPAQSADELSEQRREREPDSSSQEEGLPVQAADESVRPAENIEVASLEPARGHSYWLGLIRARIEKLKRYPVLARRRGIEGKVVVAFTITKQGEVKEAVITRSSGFALLDKAALNSVRKAAPFPYLPDRIVVPIVYKLTD